MLGRLRDVYGQDQWCSHVYGDYVEPNGSTNVHCTVERPNAITAIVASDHGAKQCAIPEPVVDSVNGTVHSADNKSHPGLPAGNIPCQRWIL